MELHLGIEFGIGIDIDIILSSKATFRRLEKTKIAAQLIFTEKINEFIFIKCGKHYSDPETGVKPPK